MAYLGKVTLTIPVGTISSDFPQNLFFHLWSVDTGQHIYIYIHVKEQLFINRC